ncbi:MAG: aldo/keto reductase [Chloroflexi bacterium]|nr:aldo/keto reductase [Chloroflexota bacterium]|tara:strand:+ start:4242 stop:5240 length:999 start_codon:yes stop_codon:yes gene_type:complete
MEYRLLGNTGLLVSAIGLGTNNFGARLDYKSSEKILHSSLDLGINMVDTADVYSSGISEEFIGKAIKSKRDQYIIATKVGIRWEKGINDEGLSSTNIKRSVEGSLKRLNSEYIDLYQTHIYDPYTPIEETLKALDDLVTQGKVRHIGCSNLMSWEMVEAIHISQRFGWKKFSTIQPEYSMLVRHVENELIHACKKYSIGILPYFPLASGFLTGKYQRDKPLPSGARLTENSRPELTDRFLTENNYNIIENLTIWAKERNKNLLDLAFAWLLANKCVSSVISGATNVDQLKANASTSTWKLSKEEIEEINKILPSSDKRNIGLAGRRKLRSER